MERISNEHNFYAQQQQSRQPTMFTPPQQQCPSYTTHQQQYGYQQIRPYEMSYMRPPLFQNSNMPMDRSMQLSNIPNQGAPLRNNMYPVNGMTENGPCNNVKNNMYPVNGMSTNGPCNDTKNSIYPVNGMSVNGPCNNTKSNMYPINGMTVNGPCNDTKNNMYGPCNDANNWNQSMSNSFSSYNHYPSEPRNRNMMASGTQNKTPNHFSGMGNSISLGYQSTVTPTTVRPMQGPANQNLAAHSSLPVMNRPQSSNVQGGAFSIPPPQYSKSLLDRLCSDYNSLPNDMNMINCVKGKPTSMGNLGSDSAFNGSNKRVNGSMFRQNTNQLQEDVQMNKRGQKKSPVDINNNPFDSNINLKRKGERCESTSDIPLEMLPQSNADLESMTQSLMEKDFNSFREFDPPSPMTENLIPSINKSPVSQMSRSFPENSSANDSLNGIHTLDSMTLSNTVQSGKQGSISEMPSTPSGLYSIPSAMENLYNHLASDKEDFLPFVNQRNSPESSISNKSGSTDGNNNLNQDVKMQGDDKERFPNCKLNSKAHPTLNLEFDDDLDSFLPDSGNIPSDENINSCQNLFRTLTENGKTYIEMSKAEPISQRSSSIPSSAPPKGKSNTRKNRNKSESDGNKTSNKKAKGAVKKGSRKAPYEGGNKSLKQKTNCPEEKSPNEITPSVTQPPTSPPIKEERTSKNLYCENTVNYKFHRYLRQLIADVHKEAGDSYPSKRMQNCEKVFLKQLSNPIPDANIFDSLKPGVENDNDIDLKNMTKRKITIYEDVPSENIYEYMEKTSMEPFRYICPSTDKTQEPSKKLVDLLLSK